MERHDVIIIGSGPAGATLAHYLKEKSIDSLIIEKGMPFRDKVCAGGLPLHIDEILPSNLRNFERNAYDKIFIDYRSAYSVSANAGKTFLYGVMRPKFDQFLREGTNVHYGEKFIKYEEDNNGIIIYTDKSKYSGKFLAGADGVGSLVSIQSGLAKNKRFIVAEEKEVQEEARDKSIMSVFLGYNFLGYGWTLPKEGFISSGSGALKGHFMKGTVNKFDSGIAPIKAFPISLWNGAEPLTKERVALVGEAGNLVDPFTAAGIYPAILSSMLLSEVIVKNLKSETVNLEQYNKLLEDKLYGEFRYARTLSSMFFPFLPLINRVILREGFINYLLELAQEGYISYKKIFKRVESTRRLPVKIAYALVKIFTR
jgi:flavin-dependent dehydrogenase